MNLIDCTLRDGGNYNNWKFSTTQIQTIVSLLDQAGATHIEVGYVGGSGSNKAADVGPTADCTPAFIQSLPTMQRARLVVQMIPSVCPLDKIEALRDSGISLVRVATYPWDVTQALGAVERISSWGMHATLNVMASSYVSPDDIGRLAGDAQRVGASVFYIADSFGALVPQDITDRIEAARKSSDLECGFHAHNNLGLAFANAIAARAAGATWIDASLAGLARGAGNLATEQLLAAGQRWDLLALDHVDVDAGLRAAAFVTDQILTTPLNVARTEIETGLDNIHFYYHPIVERLAADAGVDASELRRRLGARKPQGVSAAIVERLVDELVSA